MGYFATTFLPQVRAWAAAASVTRNQDKKIPFPKTGTGNENGLQV
tara:strand:- start:575 stop:709 length:135 start_codon:yes stop_codon:yes gene_type:complete